MAQEDLQHSVSESWQCFSCLKVMRSEKDCFILDCGESLCPKCLLLCEVMRPKARATCDGCCKMIQSQQRSPCLSRKIKNILHSLSLKSQQRSPCLPKKFSVEDIPRSPSFKVHLIIERYLGLFSRLFVLDMRSIDQVCGMLISELKKLVGFPLLHLSSEMCTKWNDLEKAQTAVIRGAYFLLWRRGHNSAAERSKSLLKAVSERERVLQSLLDTVMDFRKSKRRFQVQREQGVWQEVHPYPTQPTATGWAGNLTEGV